MNAMNWKIVEKKLDQIRRNRNERENIRRKNGGNLFFNIDSAVNNCIMNDEDIPYRDDASQRLAFGLCKKYGIDLPKGAQPADAWAAIKEKTGKGAREFYGQSGTAGADKIKFNTASKKSFSKALGKAKSSQKGKDAWRVTGMSKAELDEWHPNAKLHVTDGGSTIAIDGGDIVGVCKHPSDSLSGKDILAFAVKNGGTKLDSYDGNHGFYVKCGFEPVSWCAWNGDYAPDDWSESRDVPENIIFYKYTGKTSPYATAEEFYDAVPASADYDSAYAERDKQL